MKTQEQILQRIKDLEGEDLFGFQRGDLIDFLEWEHAKPFLKDEVTQDQWSVLNADDTTVKDKIVSYLDFAWDKANDNRGLSASRSIEHFLAWTWLIDPVFYAELKTSYDNEYAYYGKKQLVMVSEKYGFDWKVKDDDRWTNDECGKGITAKEALGR